MMAYMGLPLDLFGKVCAYMHPVSWVHLTLPLQDAFFQPYLPLQQLDMLKDTAGWLCGSTNSIVTQQKEIDLLVNVCAPVCLGKEESSFDDLPRIDRDWCD